jgi:integrase
VLRNALEAAAREEILPCNVAKLVRVPAPRYKINRGLAAQQAKATLKAADGYRLYALYVLALFLGLRRGELLGPRWQDVDLDGAKLEVVQTPSGSEDRCASSRLRPTILPAQSRSHRSAWRRSASIGSASSLNELQHGRIGKMRLAYR